MRKNAFRSASGSYPDRLQKEFLCTASTSSRAVWYRFQPFTSKKYRKSLRHSFRWQIKRRNRVLNVEKCLRQVMALMDGEDIVEFNKLVFDLFKARRVVDEKEQATF